MINFFRTAPTLETSRRHQSTFPSFQTGKNDARKVKYTSVTKIARTALAFRACLRILALAALSLICTYARAAVIPPCEAPKFDGQTQIKELPDPLAPSFSEVLLENESRSGAVAYCLSDARMSNGKNGLSFGPSQLDLHTNPDAQLLLSEIIKEANQPPKLTDGDINRIANGALNRAAPIIRSDPDPSVARLMIDTNTLLASDKSRSIINIDYSHFVSEKLAAFRSNISAIGDGVSGATLVRSSDVVKLLMLDYMNFFGDQIDSLKSYLSGNAVSIGYPLTSIRIDGKASLSDVLRYILATKQGSGRQCDERPEILRRVDTVFKFSMIDGHNIVLSQKDKEYLSGSFNSLLKQTEKTACGRQFPSLEKLIDLAKH